MKNKINFAEDKSFRRGELYLADMRGLSNQGKTEMLVVVMQNDPGFLSVPTVSVFPWPVKILEAEQQEKRPCSCGGTVLGNGDPMVLDNSDALTLTVGMEDGEDFAIVPILTQVE